MSPTQWIAVVMFSMLISYSRQIADDDFDNYNETPDNQNSDIIIADDFNDYGSSPEVDKDIDSSGTEIENTESNADPLLNIVASKRSRFYRRYPGKRENSYANDIYDCNPNSGETIRLLHALHQARLGQIKHIIFCNKLRNPKSIIANPRYIGKRMDISFQ